MKISWGYKVAGLYIGFVIMIASMVFMSATSRTDLERKDYYEEELKHDEKMKAIQNMNELDESIQLNKKDALINVIYPNIMNENRAKVHLWVYHPSNELEDKKIFYTCHESQQSLIISTWKKGNYIFRFNIEMNNKKYFYEEQVNIQ